jgi:aspartyl-tRNA(Asn)/glutamyl-tRNA(Gln) amidotransferase subunit A
VNSQRSSPAAAGLAAAYRRGVSPVEELERLLAGHEDVNATINALTYVDTDGAMTAARASAQRFSAGAPRGPLDGIPVSVKELIAVRGWPHARGSRALRHAVAGADSPLVRRLRDAGAVLWAQTASTEFGWKPLGDSLLHGPTVNPRWPALTPGGSSAGAAAAVAAGLGPVAVGTDAAGSVRIPAAFCGLCALKPSRGVMDLPGSPFSLVAAAGPITGTIEDLALALSAFTPPSGITPPLDTVRIGYLTDLGSLGRLDPSVSEMFDRCIRCLADLGLAPAPVSVRPAGLREAITVIWSAALAAVVASVPGGEHQLEPGLLRLAKQGAGYSAGDLLRAQMRAGQFGAELDVLFETGVGLLISPTAATPPFRSGLLVPPGWPGEDWLDWIPFTYPFNLTGHPAVAMPAAGPEPLPQSIQLIGPRGSDHALLSAAAQLQRALAVDGASPRYTP